MEEFSQIKPCKYCGENLEICTDEGLQCSVCNKYIHSRCLRRGSVPGGINGDFFFSLVCQECSSDHTETFCRNKMSCKKKKKWIGTVAGTLSHFATFGIFLSGTVVFNEQAFWTLMYPKLSPQTISNLYAILSVEKQKAKIKNEKKFQTDSDFFLEIVTSCIKDKELLQEFNVSNIQSSTEEAKPSKTVKSNGVQKRKNLLPSIEATSKKLFKMSNEGLSDELTSNFNISPEILESNTTEDDSKINDEAVSELKPIRLLDPMCHYNTSLSSLSRLKGVQMQVKLTGGIRKEPIMSPYSGIYLKPYIRRDTETFPTWLKLMAELQLKYNRNNKNYKLPFRDPIDYTYVQPEHIPAINSLCNQFFWPGIDLTDSLQYPDFSCVVLYKKLIIAFAFLVPDVKHTENYISFVFTRPGWRNCGIGKFLVYHLIQTSLGKDITLHVSLNNPAVCLYQKFGFKVEQIVLDFYDKYYRNDVGESKHAFFCRLER